MICNTKPIESKRQALELLTRGWNDGTMRYVRLLSRDYRRIKVIATGIVLAVIMSLTLILLPKLILEQEMQVRGMQIECIKRDMSIVNGECRKVPQ